MAYTGNRNETITLYDKFQNNSIYINKKVISFLGIAMKSIIFKSSKFSINCILYALSMIGATIIIDTTDINFADISSKICILKLAFKSIEKKDLIKLHLDVKMTGTKQFNNKKLFLVNLTFCKSPPDDLIKLIGNYLINQSLIENRKDERIEFKADHPFLFLIKHKETGTVLFLGDVLDPSS